MSTGYIIYPPDPSGNQSWQALKYLLYLLFIEHCLAIAMFDDTYYVYYTKWPYTIQNIDQDPTLRAYTLHLAILLHPQPRLAQFFGERC